MWRAVLQSSSPTALAATAARSVADTAGAPARIQWRSSMPFLAAHIVPVFGVLTGAGTTDLWMLGALYVARMFFVTAGYHRLLSHRSFRAGRCVQFVFAFGGTTAAQKGPLWWAAQHRAHHRYADTDRDVHSPRDGFWWSHVGWFLSDRHKSTDMRLVDDLARFPELRFLNRHDWIGPWAVAVASLLIGGWSGLVVGFFGSTVLLWHATFLVNSAAHVIGRRRFDTPDRSRNSAIVAAVTMGEGWHNNHHRYPAAARQGLAWWELDPTYGVLRLLAAVGLIGSLRRPPAALAGREVRP